LGGKWKLPFLYFTLFRIFISIAMVAALKQEMLYANYIYIINIVNLIFYCGEK